MSSNSKILGSEQAAEIETDAEGTAAIENEERATHDKALRTMLIGLCSLRRSMDDSKRRGRNDGTEPSFRFVDGRGKRPDMVIVTLQVTDSIAIEITSNLVTVPFKVGETVVYSHQTFAGSVQISLPKPSKREDFRMLVDKSGLQEPEMSAAFDEQIRLQDPTTRRWFNVDYELPPRGGEKRESVEYFVVKYEARAWGDTEVRIPFDALLTQGRTYSTRQPPHRYGGGRYSRNSFIGTGYMPLAKDDDDTREAWSAQGGVLLVTPPHREKKGDVVEYRPVTSGDVETVQPVEGSMMKEPRKRIVGHAPLRLVLINPLPVLTWGSQSLLQVMIAIQSLASDLMTILCDGMTFENGGKSIRVQADEDLVERLKSLELWQETFRGMLTRFLAESQTLRDARIRHEAALDEQSDKLLDFLRNSKKRLAAKAAETPKPVQGAATAATDGASDDTFEPVDDLVEEGAGTTDGGEEIVDEPEHQPVQGAAANDDTFEPVGGEEDEIIEEDGNAPSDDDSRPFVETAKPAAEPTDEQAFEPVDDSNFLQ